MKSRHCFALAVLLLPVVLSASRLQERDRSKIQEKYKWNLADLYPSDASWEAGKDEVVAEIPSVTGYRGKLLSSSVTLADALDKTFGISRKLGQLSTYAGLKADEDTREGRYQAMRQEISRIRSTFSSSSMR